MKTANAIKQLFIGLFLVAFLVGCAETSHRESTGQLIDDSAITTKVKAKIFDDPMLKVFQISVESYKGVVQLSGFVDSKKAANQAGEVAKSVDGVESVKNSLVVK
jgi:osmotically-inducible protein OsmY